jgi:uncharacterized protein YuzE
LKGESHSAVLLFDSSAPQRALSGAAGQINYSTSILVYDIQFKETTVTTEHLAEGIALDHDAEGRLAGIEILDAARRLGDPAVFKRVTFENLAISQQPAPER